MRIRPCSSFDDDDALTPRMKIHPQKLFPRRAHVLI